MTVFACSWSRSRCARFALVTLLAALSGCSILRTPFASDAEAIDEDAPQRPARIRLSPPQVFTREQLINDRLREDTFLRSQLDASATAALGSSLSRDLQTISALTAQVSVSVDPALKLNFERQTQQAQLQQSIDLVQLRAQLLSLREQIKTGSGIAAVAAAAASAGSAPSSSVTSQVSTALSDARLVALSATLDSALTALATLGDTARTNGATTTFFDDFRDRVNGREEIRGLINANSLDDSHDLEGNALYHLQFNATILPGVHKSQFGIARVTVEPPSLTAQDVNTLYYTWLADITSRLNLDFDRQDDERLAMSFMTLGPASGLYEVATLNSMHQRAARAAAAASAASSAQGTLRKSKLNKSATLDADQKRADTAVADANAEANLEAEGPSTEVRFAVPVGLADAFDEELDLRPVLAELAKGSRVTGKPACFANISPDVLHKAMTTACTEKDGCAIALAHTLQDAPGFSDKQWLSGTIGRLLTMEPAVEMGAYALGDRSGVAGPAKQIALKEMGQFEEALANARLLLGDPAHRPNACYTQEIEDMIARFPAKLKESDLQQIRLGETLQAKLPANVQLLLKSYRAGTDRPGDADWSTPDLKPSMDLIGSKDRLQTASDALNALDAESWTQAGSLMRFAHELLTGAGTECQVASQEAPCVFAFPYSTDPSSRVQRVSTVASAANAFDLAIAASANVPNSGASLGAGAAYARRAAGRVDAIERVPEVIGFSGASTGALDGDPRQYEFGWLFGPRMSLDAEGNKVRLRQEVRTVPVSVDLSLPAWWPRSPSGFPGSPTGTRSETIAAVHSGLLCDEPLRSRRPRYCIPVAALGG